jgi:hypothetical protein
MVRSRRRARRVQIAPVGNVGNQMLQYMTAMQIRRRASGVDICGHRMPLWGRTKGCEPLRGRRVAVSGVDIPVEAIARALRLRVVDELLLLGLSLDVSVLGAPDEYRNTFVPARSVEIDTFPEDLVVSVRAAEVLGDVHPDYGPLPLSIIDHVIGASGRRPVFVGQLGTDAYSTELRRRYPGAAFRPSQGPLEDFETLRHATSLLVSVSTFAWLAGWLSYNASAVHVPMLGFLNPAQRPDIDLLPTTDDRYHFYECDVRRWRGTDADFDSLWSDREHRTLSREEVDERRAEAHGRTKPSRSAVRRRLHMELLTAQLRSVKISQRHI